MKAGRLIRHLGLARCAKNTEMMCWRRYAAIASRCSKTTFSLTGEEEAERIEGV